MVDIVNTLELIIPKMRQQMFQKRIHSLDVLYETIEEEGKYFSIKELDLLFAKFGIALLVIKVTAFFNNAKDTIRAVILITVLPPSLLANLSKAIPTSNKFLATSCKPPLPITNC